jgi:prepilin-type processing-associated H-X9-DG protein
MKQLGLALANYHTAANQFPAAYPQADEANSAASNGAWGAWSVHSMLLPYVEQNQIYGACNFSISNAGGGTGQNINATIIVARIESFLCPSSPLPKGINGNIPTSLGLNTRQPGNNYFASVGAGLGYSFTAQGYSNDAPPGVFGVQGALGQNSINIGIRDITDGSSNTIAFGEWRTGDYDECKLTLPQDVVNHIPWPGGIYTMPTGSTNFLRWINQCAAAAPASASPCTSNSWTRNISDIGKFWAQGMFGYSLGNTLLPPNSPYPNCRTCTWDGDNDCNGMWGLSSYHPGGGNVAFCDGSVRFLKSSTAMQTVWALGSRDGGEVISSDSY